MKYKPKDAYWKPKREERVVLSVYVPKSWSDAILARALKENCTRSEFLRRVIAETLGIERGRM